MAKRGFTISVVSVVSTLALTSTVWAGTGFGSTSLSPAVTSPSTVKEIQIPLKRTLSFSDGGHGYVYEYNGLVNTFYVPPANFNPMQASDQQLQRYGFGKKPRNYAALAKWKLRSQQMIHAKYPGAFLTAKIGPSISTVSAPKGFDASSTSYNNLNHWAGYTIYAPAGQSLDEVYANFTQPSYLSYSSPNPKEESSWVGFGGSDGSLIIVQTGTFLSQKFTTKGFAWYEYTQFNESGQVVSGISMTFFPNNVYVTPGHEAFVDVSYHPSTGDGSFEVGDVNTGDYWFATTQPIYVAPWFDSTSAEWIDEKPSESYLDDLVDFDTIAWKNCEVMDLNDVTHEMTSYTDYKQNDYSDDGTRILSSPGSPSTSTDGFVDYFYQAH